MRPRLFPALPRLALPPPPVALALLAAAFILPGLASHDPWKFQDAIGIGIAHNMASGGELLVPRVAGLRWMVDPPLYYWVAAALGKLFQFLLEFHAAARLGWRAVSSSARRSICCTAPAGTGPSGTRRR